MKHTFYTTDNKVHELDILGLIKFSYDGTVFEYTDYDALNKRLIFTLKTLGSKGHAYPYTLNYSSEGIYGLLNDGEIAITSCGNLPNRSSNSEVIYNIAASNSPFVDSRVTQCICPIQTLMAKGCDCGHITKYKPSYL